MKKAIISEIRFYQDSIPIAVIVDAETQEEVGYLSPFRGYRFQVSQTFDGCGDLGSSDVVGLNKILHCNAPKDLGEFGYNSNLGWEDTCIEFLMGQALVALSKFSSYPHGEHYAVDVFSSSCKENRALRNGRYVKNILLATKLDQFIGETICWLYPEFSTRHTTDSINNLW